MSGRQPIVHVVDDDEAVRRSLRLLLDSVGLACACHDSATAFLDALDPEAGGCVLLDIRMPGMSGLDLQARLSELRVALPVIFLTGHGDVPHAVRAMQAGAFDFLEKPVNDQELLDRVHAALDLDERGRQATREHRDVRDRLDRLTSRERDVLELVVEGHPNKIVADRLGISERTVEIHRARVMAKMEAGSLPHLVRLWLLTRG